MYSTFTLNGFWQFSKTAHHEIHPEIIASYMKTMTRSVLPEGSLASPNSVSLKHIHYRPPKPAPFSLFG